MSEQVKNNDPFVAQFPKFEESLNGSRGTWLHDLRKAGLDSYVEQGFPTRKLEEWRFTNVSPVAEAGFALAEVDDRPQVDAVQLQKKIGIELSGPKLTFVDGRYVKSLSNPGSMPEGVVVLSLEEAVQSHPELVSTQLGKTPSKGYPFLALNTAFIQDGAFVSIPKGVKVEEPIHLVFVATAGANPAVTHPRNLILVDDGAEASILEQYVSLADADYMTNAVTEVVLGANAHLEHHRIQQESLKAYHLATVNVVQGRDSYYANHNIMLGSLLTRNDISASLNAEGVQTTLNGFYLANDDQVVDNHTRVEHAKPHCNSWEIYKGVLGGRARGVFSGTIHVHEDAQKTDAKQSNKNLLISDDAQINTKPQLRIYADDVKCTHGATIGQLDEEALNYLRCRGIGEVEARHMLINAFAGEVVEEIKDSKIRSWVDGLVRERMSQMVK